MSRADIRGDLTAACDELERARERTGRTDAAQWLAGVTEQLEYFVDGHTTDPEGSVSASPETLDTILDRLARMREDLDDTETLACLDRATQRLETAARALEARARTSGRGSAPEDAVADN